MATHLKLPESTCPKCGKVLDAVTNADGSDDRPDPGSVSVCIGCTAILEFDKDLKLVPLTAATKAELDEETMDYLEQIQRNIAEFNRRRHTYH